MKFAALFLALGCSTVFAAAPSATSCLQSSDAKDCLVGVALAALATEKSTESRIEGYSNLLSSMARAGVRRDDAFATTTDGELAPITTRWSLAVARRSYALRFELTQADISTPANIEAIATYLRSHSDGLERLAVISSACEAREDMPQAVLEKWEGVLDRQCQMDNTDANAIERGFPGLAAMAAPTVDAYNRNELALRRSIAISFETLSRYESALVARGVSAKTRESIHGVLTIGHLFNAIALANAGSAAAASKAMDASLMHLRQALSIANAPEARMVETMASWVYAKSGLRDKAKQAIRSSLAKIDRIPVKRGGDKATAIAAAIETLQILGPLR